MAVYPANLPCPLLDSGSAPEAFTRSEFIYHTRQRKTACSYPSFSASFNMTIDEFKTFRAFYDNELRRGANEFLCEWEIGGIFGTVKTVRFIEPYTYSNLGNGIYKINGLFDLINGGEI